MKIHSYICTLLLLAICTSCKQNQPNVPKATARSETEDTVTSYGPSSMVRNVRQARNGDILVAYFKGVFRYDGKSFTNLTSTIKSRSFWDVLEDRKGNLWFATKDSGVYFYNGKSFRNFTKKDGLASNQALHIYEDRAGNIWFGTGGGASRYDGKSFRNFTTKDGLPNNSINAIMEDTTGKLWFGTSGDACFYDGKTFTVFKNKDGKAFTNVWGITEDRKGTIWFGASIIEDKRGDTIVVSNGLWRYDGNAFTKVSNRGAYAVIEDKKGNIWTTGTIDTPAGSAAAPIGNFWALSRYDAKTLYNKEPLVTEIISSGEQAFCGILEASDGNIWFGSLGSGSGVYRYDGTAIMDFKTEASRK